MRDRKASLAAVFTACLLLPVACCRAQGAVGSSYPTAEDEVIKKVRLDQKLDAPVPLDLPFHDETGKPVRLGDYFGHKPVLLNLIQYRCTMLCSKEMEILAASLKELKFTVGDQFNVVTLSIDHREQPALANEYKAGYLKRYGRPGAEAGWHFLTGDETAIRRLADAVGYHFVYDARTDQFAHPDGVIVITPKGKIARYFFRLEYPAQGLRLALVEASHNKIGTLLDYWALLCYHYNPATGRYSLVLMKILRLAAVATVLSLGMGVVIMNRRSRQGQRRAQTATLTSEG